MTKKQLEGELKLYKAMYEKVHKERMAYYFLLADLANRFFYVARDQAEELKNKDFMIEEVRKGVQVKELIKLIEELIKRGV